MFTNEEENHAVIVSWIILIIFKIQHNDAVDSLSLAYTHAFSSCGRTDPMGPPSRALESVSWSLLFNEIAAQGEATFSVTLATLNLRRVMYFGNGRYKEHSISWKVIVGLEDELNSLLTQTFRCDENTWRCTARIPCSLKKIRYINRIIFHLVFKLN